MGDELCDHPIVIGRDHIARPYPAVGPRLRRKSQMRQPFIGVVAGLLLLSANFGFIAVLAVVSLFGIVLNNGIVLIDRIDIEIEEGREPFDALVEASVRRARPILLTTLTTTAGLIPLYLGGGAMFEGMAVTLMGGLVGGTGLTLLLVPVLYAFFFRVPVPEST